jgi:cytochrome c oxidase cbb3-type subunit III
MADARSAQSARLDQIASMPLDQIHDDADLARFAIAGGRSAFLVNCVPCHGSGAAGSAGYPNLNDDEWIWGGTLADIHQTIAHGIRADDPDTRYSEMPAFGADGILTRPQIADVTEYVLSLSGKAYDAAMAAEGAKIYDDPRYCTSCHGPGGVGKRDVGAPPLNNAIWLKGGDRATIMAQIWQPKHGVMPAWSGRLSDTVIKELTLYVHSLGGGEASVASAE